MRQEDKAVLDYGIGSTHFAIGKAIQQAMQQAMRHTKSPYPKIPHTLKQQVYNKVGLSERMRQQTDIVFAAGVRPLVAACLQYLVTNGAKRFVLPMPNWTSYQPLIAHMGAESLPVDLMALAKDRVAHLSVFLKSLDASLASADVFVLTPYNNPVGLQYNEYELHAIAQLLRKHSHVFVVVDDIYRDLCAANRHSFFELYPDLQRRGVYIAGVTKSHCLRVGYAVAPTDVATWVDKHLRLVSGVPLAEYEVAGLSSALKTPVDQEQLRRLFVKRDALIAGLDELPGWAVVNTAPDGANYVLVDVSHHMSTLAIASVKHYCQQIKSVAGVVVTPIEKQCLRFSVRIDSDIEQVLNRLQTWHKHRAMAEVGRSLLSALFAEKAPVSTALHDETKAASRSAARAYRY